ncbi:MAG: hypothetical protein GF334_13525 [Candidatus Altiarchaeales archaeon]|nr:hypothetical protein [Candidatus Altiarchaeales archaeon]
MRRLMIFLGGLLLLLGCIENQPGSITTTTLEAENIGDIIGFAETHENRLDLDSFNYSVAGDGSLYFTAKGKVFVHEGITPIRLNRSEIDIKNQNLLDYSLTYGGEKNCTPELINDTKLFYVQYHQKTNNSKPDLLTNNDYVTLCWKIPRIQVNTTLIFKPFLGRVIEKEILDTPRGVSR